MKSPIEILYFILLTFFTFTIKAQDIIIKNDKTELKSKVEEITETHIKYRKWENLNGPIYNLKKIEVFMILYSNGEREMMEGNNTPISTPTTKLQETTSPRQTQKIESTEKPSIITTNNSSTQTDVKKEKVDYRPTRLIIGLQSPLEFGSDIEVRLIRNFLNIGVTYLYGFPKDDSITGTQFGNLYGSIYLPINRLLKNYENQNKGLFIFGSAGISINSVSIYNNKTYKSQTYYSDFYTSFREGADYYFTKGFGVSISSYNFNAFYVGINSKF